MLARSVEAQARDGRAHLLAQLAACGQELIAQAHARKLSLRYIGIGSPGTVDTKRGIILGHSPNIPGWQGTPVGLNLSDRLGLPVYVGNDANLMAWGEYLFGAANGSRDALCITVGTGIGSGVICSGKLVTGHSFSAGELGHVPIAPNGLHCKCGLRGCLECYAGAAALLRAARRQRARHTKAPLTVQEVLLAFKAGSGWAVRAVDQQIAALSQGLAIAVNLLNPEVVVVGGGIADGGGRKYIDQLAMALRTRVLPDARADFKVAKARLGNNAGFIGAAFILRES